MARASNPDPEGLCLPESEPSLFESCSLPLDSVASAKEPLLALKSSSAILEEVGRRDGNIKLRGVEVSGSNLGCGGISTATLYKLSNGKNPASKLIRSRKKKLLSFFRRLLLHQQTSEAQST